MEGKIVSKREFGRELGRYLKPGVYYLKVRKRLEWKVTVERGQDEKKEVIAIESPDDEWGF